MFAWKPMLRLATDRAEPGLEWLRLEESPTLPLSPSSLQRGKYLLETPDGVIARGPSRLHRLMRPVHLEQKAALDCEDDLWEKSTSCSSEGSFTDPRSSSADRQSKVSL
mmetsp:Transcript_52490/g.94109  ORF Transcript_52490/g.94109 Transcript_52490/m.94109 type:complete len:109 (+) Transcript_52490:24-350(+)